MQRNGKKTVKPQTHYIKILRKKEKNISNVEWVEKIFVIEIT